jgi:hypothetical protein
MMWVLVSIAIISPIDIDAYEIGRFDSMVKCFQTREEVLVKLESYDGIPPINTQFVCVPTEYK